VNPLARLGISAGVAVAAAFGLAVMLGVLDLYLTGHSLGSITKESISHPSWGVHMSIADVILLAITVLTGIVTWWLLPPATASMLQKRK
jgi:hypothetical protein